MRNRPTRQLLTERPAIMLRDMRARGIDETRIIHAGGTGAAAGEAGKAAVDMRHRLRRRRAALLQHLLHHHDAPARPVALIAEQYISRARRRADPAMDASAQRLLGV